MKRWSDLLLRHQHPSSATYTETGTYGGPKKKVSPNMMLYVQKLRNSPYNLLYDKSLTKATRFCRFIYPHFL